MHRAAGHAVRLRKCSIRYARDALCDRIPRLLKAWPATEDCRRRRTHGRKKADIPCETWRSMQDVKDADDRGRPRKTRKTSEDAEDAEDAEDRGRRGRPRKTAEDAEDRGRPRKTRKTRKT
eukprot:gene14482-biopygen13039